MTPSHKKSKNATAAPRPLAESPRKTHGPIADLERHLPSDWWRTLFNALYLKTDGDVIENPENTIRDVDAVLAATRLEVNDRILDMCCGQGRHALELARRGFRNVVGCDRSRYLIRQARRRAKSAGLPVTFHESDARRFRPLGQEFHTVLLLGNSFGYFDEEAEDMRLLRNISELLAPHGLLMMDVADGEWLANHFEPRSWEWIDAEQFVCRERALSQDRRRIVTRELITHADKGVLADQFYAERLYTEQQLTTVLREVGYRSVRFHGRLESASTRGQDLGMMAHRFLLTAEAPPRAIRPRARRVPWPEVTVLLGDPTLPDPVKLEGCFGTNDIDTVARMKSALSELGEYQFRYLDNHQGLMRTLTAQPPAFVFNLCDEGYQNDAFKELHVPAMLETLGIPYTGSGPACLGLCYNKSLVNAIGQSLDIPTPLETYIGGDDSLATLPATFPALLKPNHGDSSIGITQNAVIHRAEELLSYITHLRETCGRTAILVQEFLNGPEYTVGLIGNVDTGLRVLPILEVDYSKLPDDLPPILGYESKWEPDSPYWTQIQYFESAVNAETKRRLIDYSTTLFERLGCRDYARFDFRANADGQVKLLEANPNPGWCWDGKLNLMAGFDGLRYADMLRLVIEAAQERTRNTA